VYALAKSFVFKGVMDFSLSDHQKLIRGTVSRAQTKRLRELFKL